MASIWGKVKRSNVAGIGIRATLLCVLIGLASRLPAQTDSSIGIPGTDSNTGVGTQLRSEAMPCPLSAETTPRGSAAWQDLLLKHEQWVRGIEKYASTDDFSLELAVKSAIKIPEGAMVGGKRLELIDEDLDNPDFAGADLRFSVIEDSWLIKADFRCVNLRGATLTGNNFENANLAGANLWGADLTRTRLKDVNLDGADLRQAVLADATYEPLPGSRPKHGILVSTTQLETVRFENLAHGLHDLRNDFRQAGYRQQERQLTYAIMQSQWEKLNKEGHSVEAWFNLVFFDVPVAYGLYPGRALQILAALMLVFAVPYSYAFSRRKRSDVSGVWRIWHGDQPPFLGERTDPELVEVSVWKCFPYGLYFSLLSAFHIGWRDLNVGNWLARIQPRAVALLPVGWVRVVSGVQSLISVYLLAIWLLSYFGRPFG